MTGVSYGLLVKGIKWEDSRQVAKTYENKKLRCYIVLRVDRLVIVVVDSREKGQEKLIAGTVLLSAEFSSWILAVNVDLTDCMQAKFFVLHSWRIRLCTWRNIG